MAPATLQVLPHLLSLSPPMLVVAQLVGMGLALDLAVVLKTCGVRVLYVFFVIHHTRRVKEKGSAVFAGELERHDSRAFLRRLPEGAFELSVAVRHPYSIPSSLAVPEQGVDLVRGKLVNVAPVFQRVGGLVEVYVTGAAARLVPAEGDPTISLVMDAKVSFPGTPPGTYRVEECEDAACLRVVRSWERVDVAAARTVTLREQR